MTRNIQRGQDLIAGFDRNKIRPTRKRGGMLANLITLISVLVILASFATISWTFMTDGSPAEDVTEIPKRSKEAVLLFLREPKAVARDYDMTGKPPYVDQKNFKMRIDVNRTKTGLNAIDSELHERCTKKISKIAADWTVKKGVAYFHFEDAEKFLACSMRTQRSRFCDPAYRKRLALRFQDYLRARTVIANRFTIHEKSTALISKFSGGDKSKTGRLDEKTIKAMLELEEGTSKDQRAKSIKRRQTKLNFQDVKSANKLTPALSRALSDLSEKGLFGAKDFGTLFSEPPRVLVPYLKDVAAPC
ncbi:hypothetical protein [Cohaesibacter celericrescens]|uniref:Uncharacterized protein n=1 Tax=Cohaesibacter celericrescens TaxID=2067669 RepID=A0A2N5XU29_9HYPH|nr:hypothetical protein [Cohaesibacter celericrescens]PLW78004.1 hypothetical protein C0081_06970 [Cohaesibacter celericrescens]